MNGRVVSIAGTAIGRSVQAGQPLFSILPEGSVLEAELFVPSRAVGFVEEGQEVRLLYDAFPYQRFGSFTATITKVTKTILAPNETFAPFEVKEPVYWVTAKLTAKNITARGSEIALQSGMTLQANIVLERRSFIDWLLEPLRAVGGRT
ncbi:MAG: HlyD family efflux transporter periplasmic adaptor subunit [Kordiimonadaceae bacterium]|nr:HlyD family efflux transporter periplasmic adaptor subunit [Kordiimonadaceae bacterium]